MELYSDYCEACKSKPATVTEISDDSDQPYKLCIQCHERLTSLSLRPIEWYNLAVIHSSSKYYLHDDFYEEDGGAVQPEEKFKISRKDRSPKLNVCDDVDSLIDFTITRWFVEDDVIHAFKKHDKSKILHLVKSRYYETGNIEIKWRMLEIVAEVLGQTASEWIRELWNNYDEDFFAPLSWATSSSLPVEEGLQHVFEKLNEVNEKKLPARAFTCLYRFRSSKVLDWMEQYCTVFDDNWGRLAAVSFPTWGRMKIWLEKGRPLSLIALDTMENCVVNDGDLYVGQYNPIILKTDKDEVESVLSHYLSLDRVPRVRNKVEYILEYKDEVFE